MIDLTKGDEIGSTWNIRHPIVRKAFDELEAEFAYEAKIAEAKAVKLMAEGKKKEAEELLTKFTEECFRKALETVRALQKEVVKYGKPLSPKLE